LHVHDFNVLLYYRNQISISPIKGDIFMKKERLFVERRPEGDYAVRKSNSKRASDVLRTQSQAIARAKEMNPDTQPLVERVRHTKTGSPDKWRTP
jgi:Uncharacterized protein conserved in bacteria (DUF2188)